MEEKYEPKTVDGKFMESVQKKIKANDWVKKEKDPIKVEHQSMEGILKDIAQVPDKLHMTGSPDKVSVKPIKSGENPMLTGKGKQKFKSTMNESY